jgi:hypothetical protein
MAKMKSRAAASFPYVLIGDRDLPPEQQTQFVLRTLTVDEHAAALALEHIVSIENFPVGAPQPWPDERERRRDYLGMLMPADLQELGGVLFHRAEVGDEEKNFSPPARTSASGDNSSAQAPTTAPPAGSAG